MYPTVSLIICTYQRQSWMDQLLASIAEQTVLPEQTIIVDASPAEIPYKVPVGLNMQIIRSDKMQLTYQKNLGLNIAKGDIIFFLDDDLLLEIDYIEQSLKVFEDDQTGQIGAVSAYITNQWGNTFNQPDFFMRLTRFLGIYDGDFMPGSVSPSGIFIELNKMKPFSGTREIDFVPGGCTAFRKNVFEKHRPPLVINKYGGEDKTFSRMIARDWKMVLCGDAKLQHFSAPGGARQTHFKETRSTARFNILIQKKYGKVHRNTMRIRLYYILSTFRMYLIAFFMLASIHKTKKSFIWWMRGSGYLAGAFSKID